MKKTNTKTTQTAKKCLAKVTKTKAPHKALTVADIAPELRELVGYWNQKHLTVAEAKHGILLILESERMADAFMDIIGNHRKRMESRNE
jgi:hypothetical protein